MQETKKDINVPGKRYIGETRHGVRNGQGKMAYPHGGSEMFSYDGKWKMGTKVGGTLKIDGLSSYVGEFDSNGEITGYGKRTWDDGREYEGQWVLGEMNGKGKWTKKCVDYVTDKTIDQMYEGDFVDNRRQGNGVFDDGNVIYTGSFASHRLNGEGKVVARDGSFIMEGKFVDNIISGHASVQWNDPADGKPISSMNCYTWEAGLPSGIGSYKCSDNSYEFEGRYEDSGNFNQDDISTYMWSSIDRTELIVAEEAAAEAAMIAAGGKPGKKAPPKKGDAPEPLSVPAGACLGKLTVRTGGQRFIAAKAAEAAPVKGKKGAPEPAEGDLPLPEPPAGKPVPCERKRALRVTLRSVIEPEEGSDNTEQKLSDPLPLWLRNQTQEEFANNDTRFPISAIEYSNGVLRSKPDDIAGKGSPSELFLEGGAQESMADPDGSDTICHLIPLDAAICANVILDDVAGAPNGLNFVTDVKLDFKSITEGVRAESTRVRSEAIEAAKAQAQVFSETKAAEAEAANAEKNETADSEEENAKKKSAEDEAKNSPVIEIEEPAYAEISILSVSRMYNGQEIAASGLDLVLLVPMSHFNLRRLGEKETSNKEEAGENPGNDEKEAKFDKKWQNCIYELRLRAQNSDANSVEKTVCAKWNEDVLNEGQWHSIALSISGNTSECADLHVDGCKLVHSTEISSDGSVLGWLPEKVVEVPEQVSEKIENKETKNSEEATTNEEEVFEKEEPPIIRQVIRCGGKGYCGAIRGIALCSLESCDAVFLTDCFRNWRSQEEVWASYKYNEWYSRACVVAAEEVQTKELRNKEREEANFKKAEKKKKERREAEAAGTELPAEIHDSETDFGDSEFVPTVMTDVRYDCKIETSALFHLRCGEAVFDRIFIPSNLPPGKYALQIDDCVDSRCLMTNQEVSANEAATVFKEDRKAAAAEGAVETEEVGEKEAKEEIPQPAKLKELADLRHRIRSVRAIPSLTSSVIFTVFDKNTVEA